MRRALFVLLLGCSNDPLCSEWVDATGYPAAYCPSMDQTPVCDAPGEEARFEESGGEVVLIGGDDAQCTMSFELECPPGTTGEPYCLTVPRL